MADLSTKFPVFPPAFGQDGGKFLKHYDQLADELDEDMTKPIKENLDGMLIFVRRESYIFHTRLKAVYRLASSLGSTPVSLPSPYQE